ncbi:MAG: glycosyltransferase [Planctomycetes bacterium]|nr:glycosyltransferase [Planctomycetota bacterium]
MRRDTISVVTCTLNAAESLPMTLAAVHSQTYRPIEHLVIDAQSSDGTADLAKRTPNVTCISEPDLGVYDAFSKGARMARGDIVHILGADDVYTHQRVLGDVLARFGDMDIVHGKVRLVDATGRAIGVVGRDVRTKRDLLRKFRVAHPAMFVRRSIYERFGTFHNCFHVAGDYEFCLRIWDKVRIRFIDDVLVDMRVGGLSSRNPMRSHREALAAQLLHGKALLPALSRHFYEVLKRRLFFGNR